MRKIIAFLEKLPDNIDHIVVRQGDTRKEETIAGKYDPRQYDDNDMLCDAILDNLIDDSKFRILAMNEKGLQIKAITITPQKKIEQGDHIQTLIDGFLSMVNENRRVMSVLAGVIEDREETLEYVLQSLIQTKTEQVESDLAIGALEMENSIIKENQNASIKARALEIAEKTASAMLQPKITPENIKQFVIDNPAILDDIVNDEEFIKIISDKMLK